MSRRHHDGIAHLRARDLILGALIDAVGPCTLTQRRDRFDALVRSILSQQISTAAARTIRARLEERIGTPKPDTILAMSVEELRECGISPQKAKYLHDLAEHVASGRLPLQRLGRLSDDDVIDRLIAVKGIGRWTGQMFLMFSLGRPDVLPHDDLGIRAAMRRLYELPDMPKREEMDAIAAPWRPHATLACWYLWRSLELKPPTKLDVKIKRR
jgi:DNA-3-methyladenine glycosylase II